jgi:hypothetical protein
MVLYVGLVGPVGSGLLRLSASSIKTDPEGTRRIVWTIKRMIKGHPTKNRMPKASGIGLITPDRGS